MNRRGTVVEDGDTATITFRRVYGHALEHVWDAIATPAGLRGWLSATDVTLEPREGGAIAMVSGPGRYHSTGTILTWSPPRLFEYEWNVAPVPEMPRGERAIFRYELAAHADGTLLVVTYRRITREVARGFLPGLHVLLDALEAQLDGTPPPDWEARFAELRAEYDWQGHAPAPGE